MSDFMKVCNDFPNLEVDVYDH